MIGWGALLRLSDWLRQIGSYSIKGTGTSYGPNHQGTYYFKYIVLISIRWRILYFRQFLYRMFKTIDWFTDFMINRFMSAKRNIKVICWDKWVEISMSFSFYMSSLRFTLRNLHTLYASECDIYVYVYWYSLLNLCLILHSLQIELLRLKILLQPIIRWLLMHILILGVILRL